MTDKSEIEKLIEAEKTEALFADRVTKNDRHYNDLVDAMKAKLSVTPPGSPLFGDVATDYRLKQLEQSIADIKKHLGI